MFFGEFKHNIDAKGRLSIPAKMRNQCGDSVYVMKGNDGCLAVYTQAGFDEYYAEILALSRKKKKNRTYKRLVTSRVNECEFDKLGRINIPAKLREEAHLTKECTVVGAGDCIELWNSEEWESYYDDNVDQFDELSEELDDEE